MRPREPRAAKGAESGLIGGFKLGDSWDDIKGSAGDYKVRDELRSDGKSRIRQLRHDLGDSGNGWFYGFVADDKGAIDHLIMTVHGNNGNTNQVKVTAHSTSTASLARGTASTTMGTAVYYHDSKAVHFMPTFSSQK